MRHIWRHQGLMIVGMSLGSLLFASSASAAPTISDNFPNQSNFSPAGNVMLEVANDGGTSSLRIDRSSAMVYFPSAEGGKIYVNDFNHCLMDGGVDTTEDGIPPGNGSNNWDTSVRISKVTEMLQGGEINQSYSQVGNPIRNKILDSVVTRTSYAECSKPLVLEVNNLVASKGLGRDHLYPVKIEFNVRPNFDDAVPRGRVDYMVNAFSLRAESRVSGAKPKITYDGSRRTINTEFGLQNRSPGEDKIFRRFQMEFGADCSVTSPREFSVSWRDDDYRTGVNSDRDIEFSIYQRLPGESNFKKIPIRYSPESGGREYIGEDITPMGGNIISQSARVTLQPEAQYYWEWRNVYDANGIQFTVPFDGIYYDHPCPVRSSGSWRLEGTTDLRSPAYVEAGSSVIWKHLVRNAGEDPVDKDATGEIVMYVRQPDGNTVDGTTRIVNLPKKNANTIQPFAQPGHIAWDQQSEYPVNDSHIGKEICSYITWRPLSSTMLSTSGQSTPKCVKVGKSPYLAIRGGDALADGGFKQTDGTCTAPDSSYGFKGRDLPNDARGNYGEYALRALQSVENFGSGGLVGKTGSSYNPLTFANVSSLGYFGTPEQCLSELVDPVAARGYSALGGSTVSISELVSHGSNNYYRDGSLTINGGTIPRGVKLRIVVEGDVYIRNDISYENNGYAGIADNLRNLPMLTIVALPRAGSPPTHGNIKIDNNVKRLDGYFEARDAFATCNNDGPVNKASNIDSSSCGNPLVVNGVIIARQILAKRVSGTHPSEMHPAEVFNYRPDFVLERYDSSPLDDRTSIMSEMELPPRY